MNQKCVRLSISSVALLATVAVAGAQQGAFKRTELQRTDLSAPGREGVMAVADIPAGAGSGRHTHPGEELAYILEGAILLEVEGKAPVTLKVGQAFAIPAGQAHSATNKGTAPARVLATYVVEKGKPVATPVR